MKHSLPISGKKLPISEPFLSVPHIWTRMETALRSVNPRATKKDLAALIKSGGTSITVRALSAYASGTSLPGLDVVAAVSVATKVSIDELVFGIQARMPTQDIARMIKQAEELIFESKRRTGLGQGELTSEREELLDMIDGMTNERIELLLSVAKELRAK